MRRPTLNLLIDAAAFAGFVFLVSTGLMVRYVLPPGSGRRTLVWGLDRHEWGALHFWVAAAFLGILALHLVLHRRWILSALRGRPRQGSGARAALGVVGLLAILALAVAPLVSPVERLEPAGPGHGRVERPALRGWMSLADVERETGVPAGHLLRELGLAPDVSRQEPLARLASRHGFRMEDVRRIVRGYEPSGHP